MNQNEEVTTAELKQEILKFFKAQAFHTKLSAIEIASKVAGIGIAALVGFGLGFLALVFISFFVSELLVDYLGHSSAGYAVISGFYLLVFILSTTLFKKPINKFFTNRIIKLLARVTFHKQEDEN